MFRAIIIIAILIGLASRGVAADAQSEQPSSPQFSRHVAAVFSRLGCNSGRCHGAVQGKNGFRLSLFAARPDQDFEQIVRGADGRRINLLEPHRSLILQKASAQLPHAGGRLMPIDSPEYAIVHTWLAAGAQFDDVTNSQLIKLEVEPSTQVVQPGATFRLRVSAHFADGTSEDVTSLCTFDSRDTGVAAIDRTATVKALEIGDTSLLVRFRATPAAAQVLVTRENSEPFPEVTPQNFIDQHIVEKLRLLDLPPSELTDDATFLRRVRLDVTGQLPSAQEVREFLADSALDKRDRKIDQLLSEPGYAALWALKFCDLLRASDFGIYADGLAEHYEAPRFQAWIRKRLEENTPYDQFAARIIGATSRDGRSAAEWAQEVVALQEGYTTPRRDLQLYAARQTLDIYWQRKDAVGVPGALQVAHAFLGLRLECAQCHRHPHDVWQQDDLLSFANFFTKVRTVGFQGDNEQKFPDDAKLFHEYSGQSKKLLEEAKQLREGRGQQLATQAQNAQSELNRIESEISQLVNEISQSEQQFEERRNQAIALETENPAEAERLRKEAADLEASVLVKRPMLDAKRAETAPLKQVQLENETVQKQAADLEQRGRVMEEVATRVLHSQIFHRQDADAANLLASVTSPLGTYSSSEFRLPGATEPLTINAQDDPRLQVVQWMQRPDNPYFAKAIVNRIWAHYFGRGIVDPPDDLSPFNPPTHPQLLDELCRKFVNHGYDLKWLHRTILSSRTYQQSSLATPRNQMDRSNYAYFYLRRLPAEVLIDAIDQATATREDMDMQYYHWTKNLRTVEVPYKPRNSFVAYMLEQFGRPARNSSSQCDCERRSDASVLQVLSIANHPHVWQKITALDARVDQLIKQSSEPAICIEELYLTTLGRMPSDNELQTCRDFIGEAESPTKGLQGVLWSLLNTHEFVLQH